MDSTKKTIVSELATSRSGSLALALYRNTAHLIDISKRCRVGSINVLWDTGGDRAAVDEAARFCVTAAYTANTVTAYTLPSGEPMWRRTDLRKVQHTILDERRAACIVIPEKGAAVVLDPHTGETVQTLWSLEDLFSSRDHDLSLVDDNKRAFRLMDDCTWNELHKLDRGAALLDACFSPTAVFTSESGGPLRAFALDDGKELWRIYLEHHHYLRICFCEELSLLCAVRWYYVKSPAVMHLHLIDCETGAIHTEYKVSDHGQAIAFVQSGAALLTQQQMLVDTRTGTMSEILMT